MDGLTAGNTASQGSIFLNDSKLVNLGKGYPLAIGIYKASALITDGSDGIDEFRKILRFKKEADATKNPEEKSRCSRRPRVRTSPGSCTRIQGGATPFYGSPGGFLA